MADFGAAYDWAMQLRTPKASTRQCRTSVQMVTVDRATLCVASDRQSGPLPWRKLPKLQRISDRNWLEQFNVQMLANSVFDMMINAGPSVALQLLQRMVGVTQDGILGPLTVDAVNRANPKNVVADYAKVRCQYYDGIDGSPADHASWKRRAMATCA